MLSRATFKRIFDVTLVIKGIAAVIDLVAATVIFTTGNEIVVRFFAKITTFATHFEGDGFASKILNYQAHALTTTDVWLITGYFAIHGIINIVIVEGIWFRRQWAYSRAMRILLFFFVYQSIRLFFVFSYWLFVITLYDLVVMLLLYNEYRYAEKEKRAQHTAHKA
jgi:uncharacterized membrane protein